MKKNWLQKLLSWYKYMNNNTFTYTNILLNEIKEIKGEKIILKINHLTILQMIICGELMQNYLRLMPHIH